MKNIRAASQTDGYKVGHGPLYADGTSFVYNNLTPRSDKIYLKNCTRFYDGRLVFVGAQGAVQEVHEFWQDFFDAPKDFIIGVYAKRMMGYLGGEVEATKQLAALHDLGYLPLRIKTLKEGKKVKMGIPVMTVTNTNPEFFWLTNYLETLLSDLTWKPSTNATIASEYHAICKHYAGITGTDDFTVSIQCHDFSMRGMSGPEDAARSGFAHLIPFIGTDTLPAMDYAELYYDAPDDSLIAISVIATEHAVATNNILRIEQLLLAGNLPPEQHMKYYWAGMDKGWTMRQIAEMLFILDLITRKAPTGIVSYVSDSFDYWFVVTEILPVIKEVVISRQPNGLAPGKLVIRPDSGDPVEVVCGIPALKDEFETVEQFYSAYDFVTSKLDSIGDAQVVRIGEEYRRFDRVDPSRVAVSDVVVPECEVMGSVHCLWSTFGGTTTPQGYNLLDSHIGMIYGDSITTKRCMTILDKLASNWFASGNIVFGVGSYTYQCNTRDTFGFAVKATNSIVDGDVVAIFKDPKTDSKKKSAKGLLYVGLSDDEYFLVDDVTPEIEAAESNQLRTIYLDGKFVRRTTLADVRAEYVANFK